MPVSYSKVANGSISPSRFVRLDTTADGKVLQSGAGERIFGISQEGTRNVPGSGLGMDDGFAAKIGENIRIYGPGDMGAMLELGGTVVVGARLKADANGAGVSTTTADDEIGAIAIVAGTSGQVVPVQLVEPDKL